MRDKRRSLVRATLLPGAGLLAFVSLAFTPTLTQTAVANGDTRTIRLFHVHTKETIEATYRVNGQYDAAVLKQLNWFLRDWRRDEPTSMDPRLFDVVWEVYRSAGAGGEPVTVMSAYRSPETNAMLRRRSRAVAEYSQHMLGKAMDTSLPGMSMAQVREVGMKLQRGGVGYYPTAGTPFVHLDVGSVRSWPRMPYEQLVRLFPDGKTVHLPANGQPLARYEEARAEIAAYGGVAPPSSTSGGFFAWLFGRGGGAQEAEDDEGGSAAPSRAYASRGGRGMQTASLMARPTQNTGASADDGGRDFFASQAAQGSAARPTPPATPAPAAQAPAAPLAQAEANLPRGETFISPTAAPASRQTEASTEAELARGLELASGAVKGALADAPMPPRRPTDLVAQIMPVPPVRPLDLLARRPSLLSPSATAYAGLETSSRRNPIDALLARDLTGSTHGADRKPTGQSAALPPMAGLRSAGKTVDGRNTALIVPARLDHTNFRAMTASEPAARMTTQTVGGPAVTATRSAARVDPAVLAPVALHTSSSFAPAADVPSGRFVSTAGRSDR